MNAPAHSAEFPVPAPRGVGGSLFLWLSLLVAYVLSTGPAVKLFAHGGDSEKFLSVLYAPLFLLAEHCHPVKDFFEWYLFDVWGWRLF